jgi:hypothetical protein
MAGHGRAGHGRAWRGKAWARGWQASRFEPGTRTTFVARRGMAWQGMGVTNMNRKGPE